MIFPYYNDIIYVEYKWDYAYFIGNKTAGVTKMKKKNRVRSLILISLIILLAGILAFSAYQALSIYIPQKREQDRFSELRELVHGNPAGQPTGSDGAPEKTAADNDDTIDLVTLTVYNDEAVAWLRIPDTPVDYPVMKSSDDDPEYYLHRDFDRSYSFSGCLFVGQYCDTDSDVFVIYGHNMNNGSMFGELDRFADPDFADSHRDVVLDTLSEHKIYRVFAAFQTKVYDEEDDDDDVYRYYNSVGKFDESGYAYVLDSIRSLSLIDIGNIPEYPAQLMLLSTCAYHTEDGRFVVAAYRVQ